jgi:hypothetical protein
LRRFEKFDIFIFSAFEKLGHIQWQCKETEEETRNSNMTKKVWEKGEERAKMLVEYMKTSDYTTDYI